MVQAIVVSILLLASLPTFGACDPNINLKVDRPYTSESEPTVVAASATSGCRIVAISVYVDYKLIYQQHDQSALDGRLVMGNGPHRVVIMAQNSAGTVAKDVRYIVTNADPVEPPAGCDLLDSVQYTGDHVPFTAKSPVRVGMVAHSDSAPISSMRLYIDGINRAQTWGTSGYCLPVAMLSLKPGYHFINVQAWDALGHIYLTGSIVQVVP